MWNSHKGIGENIKEELTEEQRESISGKGNGVKNIYSGPETSFGSFFFFFSHLVLKHHPSLYFEKRDSFFPFF